MLGSRCESGAAPPLLRAAAPLHPRRHWATGKAGGGPEPGDLSVRATSCTLGGGDGGDFASRRLRGSFVRPFLPAGTGGRLLKPLLPRHLLLAGAVGLSALPGTPLLAQAAGRIIDHAGDTVTLRAPARRVVSLLPPATELLFAIGAGDRVVGRSRWCTEPHGASAVPDVGDFLPPAIEPIVALRPDLVVLYQAGTNSGVAARLRALGIPTLQLRIDRLAELRRAALLLGEATGRLPAADSVVRALDRALRSASLAPPRRPPTVLLVAWSDPPVAIGRGAVQSELVDRAGGRNVLHDVAAASSPVSLEAIVARNPDIVVLPTGTAGAALTSPAWQVVPAVREGRVLTIDHSAFTWPSVRAPEVIALLSERLRAAVVVAPR